MHFDRVIFCSVTRSQYSHTNTLTNLNYCVTAHILSLSHTHTQTCAGTAGWRLFRSLRCLQPSLSASVRVKHTSRYTFSFLPFSILFSHNLTLEYVHAEKQCVLTTSVRSSSLTAWMVSLHSANRVSYRRSFVSLLAAWQRNAQMLILHESLDRY